MFYQHFQCLSDPFGTFVGDKMSILVDRIFFQHFQCLQIDVLIIPNKHENLTSVTSNNFRNVPT
jgi:hypothetical protein